MDIEDLLADDDQFKDENIDDDVDEAALLGSSGDEDEISESTTFQGTKSSHYDNLSASNSYGNLEDESDVLEVNIDAELDDSLTPETTKDGDPSFEVTSKMTNYKENPISVRMTNPSDRRENVEMTLQNIKIKEERVEMDSPTHTSEPSNGTDVFDEESDEENIDNDRRGRFKSERGILNISTSLKSKFEIPDNLDSVLSAEETQRVNAYLENQQRRKMYRRQRGNFRGRKMPHNFKSSMQSEQSSSPEQKNLTGGTKIHINPHFFGNANPLPNPMHSNAPSTFIPNVPTISSASSNYIPNVPISSATSNYIPPAPSNFNVSSSGYNYPENNRYPAGQVPLSSAPITPTVPYSPAPPLPNLQVPPPAPSIVRNYIQPSSAAEYALSGHPSTLNQPTNPPTLPNVWVPPPMQVMPPQMVDSAPPRFNYSGASGFNQPPPPIPDNSYQNYPDPAHQQTDRIAQHNIYASEPPSWFRNQHVPSSTITTNTSFSQNQSSHQSIAQSMPRRNYQKGGNFSNQHQKLNAQRRPNQNLTRQPIKRSGNTPMSDLSIKRQRFDDNQRKSSASFAPKQNSNIKQIPLVENLSTVAKTFSKPKVTIEEDEETKEYRKKVEEQRLQREEFLRLKEERRKMQAAQKTLEIMQKKITTASTNNVILTVPTVEVPSSVPGPGNKIETLAKGLNTKTQMTTPVSNIKTLVSSAGSNIKTLVSTPGSVTKSHISTSKVQGTVQRPGIRNQATVQQPGVKPKVGSIQPTTKRTILLTKPKNAPANTVIKTSAPTTPSNTSAQNVIQKQNLVRQNPVRKQTVGGQKTFQQQQQPKKALQISNMQQSNVLAPQTTNLSNQNHPQKLMQGQNTQINVPIQSQNPAVQKSAAPYQKFSTKQVAKTDLRNKINKNAAAARKKIIKIPANTQLNMKSLSQKNKIRFGVSQPATAVKKKALMTLATAAARSQRPQNIKLNTGKVVRTTNFTSPFRRPFFQQRPMQNRNLPNPPMNFPPNTFPGNRFPNRPPPPFLQQRQETPRPFPFPPNVIRNQGPPNPQFNMNPRMPFLPLPDNRMPFFREQSPPPQQLRQSNVYFERPQMNFNPRMPPHIPPPQCRPPENFFIDHRRPPPPAPPQQRFPFPPPQVFRPHQDQFRPNRMPAQRYRPPQHRQQMHQNMYNNNQRKYNSRKAPVSGPPRPVLSQESQKPAAPTQASCPSPKEPKVPVASSKTTVTSSKSALPEMDMTSNVVVVSNLSSSTTEVQLKKLSTAMGPIKSIKYLASDRKAVIEFCNVQDASKFQTKYRSKRYQYLWTIGL